MTSFNNHEHGTLHLHRDMHWSYTPRATKTDIQTQTDGILGNLGTPEYPASSPTAQPQDLASPWEDLG